ncbi:ATP-dependent Clp protease ATP-binding subunit CLPT1, chloroplastic-like [Andrographis paniculata]|uniref:ATP-dependent Clp protease ATP-binding subunit CLPT1, chloroplastic-like n=1 Tax=Andrographis paniculata TaxID=175694 RepID=UPI0021E8A6E5|nr:ATP-dependent Clp protease ATP-binding subunit CLPT1, chloroplastic-like [Andrographis paniculata]
MAAQGLSVLPFSNASSAANPASRRPFEQCLIFSVSNPFVGVKLLAQPSSFCLIASKRRGFTVATVSFSLPNTIKEGVASDKAPKWSARSIKSFAMAELEARKLKYTNTGTEALLMGILVEGTSLAAKFLRENGITLFKVRDETVKLLGKSDMYIFSPEHPPLTGPAQRALNWAVEEKLKSGEDGEVTVTHILLGIWSEKEYAGHKILASLGFDDEKAKELAKNMDKDIILSFK